MFIIEEESMELLLFVYGLSFFALGLSVLLVKSKQSEYFYANKIWLLGAFAVTHAFEDWISLFKYIHKDVEFVILNYTQSVLLFVSYIFLFEFSRFIIRKGFLTTQLQKHIIYKFYYPPAIYPISMLIFIFLVYLHPDINGINASIRYTYGFWGAVILGGGLYYYGDTIKKSENINTLKLYFKISGIAFVFYAIFSGLVVDKVSYFPGNLINTENFLNFFHLPVQAFRGLCALVLAVASIKTLSVFRFELINKLNESYENIKKFSSNASHQIKTPLTAIRLQIHLALKKNNTKDEFKDSLFSIDKELTHLQNMLKNMLLLTRMQNMNIKDTFVDVEIDSLVLELYEQYSIIANTKGVLLDIGTLNYLHVKGEKTLINILISNLIDNAIKFTSKGKKVTISIENHTLIVKDEGAGIDKKQMPNIFDEFYSQSTLEEAKGYGLGLSMVQKIANIHKAKIAIQSEKSEGTLISIKF